jgi:Na+-driven multidrug efflux pump
MILSGALRGAGDTRVPLLITFAGYVLVRIPGAYWLAWPELELPLIGVVLPAVGWGAAGAWIAMVTDTYVRAALVLWRFTHGGWTKVEV